MNLLIYGPPGAGKSTFGRLISFEYKIPYISTGDIFREHIANHTEIGKKIELLLNQGHFAPDDITNPIIIERLNQKDCQNGFILDGYPRNIAQTFYFGSLMIELDAIINLKVSNETIINRLTNRAKIEKRVDDANESVILERIKVYNKETRPCLLYFRKFRNLVKDIEADGDATDIFLKIKSIL